MSESLNHLGYWNYMFKTHEFINTKLIQKSIKNPNSDEQDKLLCE